MKKSILELGKLLNKIEQKTINGGDDCPTDYVCYGPDFPFLTCGSCDVYNALPNHCKYRVIGDCNNYYI